MIDRFAAAIRRQDCAKATAAAAPDCSHGPPLVAVAAQATHAVQHLVVRAGIAVLMKLARQAIIDHLHARLAPDPLIRAATLGGSDATGRADDLSDVDLFMIVEPGADAIEHAAAAFETAIIELSPVSVKWRLPMPTWHGFNQAFYQLRDAEEWTMLDWLIVEKNHPGWTTWLEQERHGVMRVLFDKDGLITPAHVDRAALEPALRKKVEELRVKVELFRHLPVKLVGRGKPGEGGRPVDAYHFYHSLIVRPLVDMLRIVHCPERYDFGFRYVRDDLPREKYEALISLCYPGSSKDIPELTRRALVMFYEALAQWDSRTAGAMRTIRA